MSTLQVLTSKELKPPVESVAGLFHRLNRVLPEDQIVVKVSTTTKVAEALRLMRKGHFSQLPVCEGETVLGLFSHRSFAEGVLRVRKSRIELADLPVEEFIEDGRYARVTDEFNAVFETLDKENAVLVGEPDLLQGIVTPMDLLKYLYNVANHFVLVAEIELSLRALISIAVDDEILAACAKLTLSNKYGVDKVPTRLIDMDFSDYVHIIGHGDNWKYFMEMFGGMRETTRAKLDEIRDLRNDIFHFKRDLTWEDHERLVQHRDWVLMKARKADARQKGAHS